MFDLYFIAILLAGLAGAAVAAGRKIPLNAARIVFVIAGAAALAAAIFCLTRGEIFTREFSGLLPFGKIALRLDPFAAWFVIPITLVAIFGAFNRDARLTPSFAGYAWLTAAMWSLLIAADAISFLFAWELASLAAWMLLITSPTSAPRRQPAWWYLIFTEISALFLIAAFILLARNSGGSFVFADWRLADAAIFRNHWTTGILLAALLGFGCKGGFFGVHLWLPETYGAMRGADAALLSAAMSKLSFYGLWRALSSFPAETIPAWFAVALIIVGMLTALRGIASALMENKVRRLIAYSSMENMGVLAVLSGFALLGLHAPAEWGGAAILAFLLYVWHHAFAKATVFYGADNILALADNLDELGGAQKILPRAGAVIAIGAGALAALPFTSGLAPELLLASAALKNLAIRADFLSVISALGVLAFFGLLGGLTVFAMFRFYAIIFLGAPRSLSAGKTAYKKPGDAGFAAFAGAFLTIFLGAAWWLIAPFAGPAIAIITPVAPNGSVAIGAAQISSGTSLDEAAEILRIAAIFSLVFIVIGVFIYWLRQRRRRGDTYGETWNCGYALPSAKIQYTGFSLTEPVRVAGQWWLRPRLFLTDAARDFFPRSLAYSCKIRDLTLTGIYAPLYRRLTASFAWLRVIQHGRVHLYIFYIVAALAGSLIWALIIDR